jgi:eukaryotic-like serine/threonine-protein kinase
MSSEKPRPLPQGPLQVGQVFIWQYEILQLIGSGGHAFVYRARHRFLGHLVAIKVLHRAAGVSLEMLRRGQAEAQIEFQLKHPGIVSVLDAGIDNDGLLYIVMELLQGRSMRDALIELGKLQILEVLRLGAKVARAIEAAHRAGVVHRDLKPENLFFTRDNELKVIDFGIAKIDDAAGWQTQKDMVMGTAYYLSPEQVMAHPVTPRSDIYALGVIMAEALLGQPPVLRQVAGRPLTFKLLTRIIVSEQLPPLNELDPRIPAFVDKLLTKATAKRPAERFATMGDFADACDACANAVEADLLQRGVSQPPRELWRKTPSASGVETIGTPPEHDTAPASRPPFFGGLSSSTATVAPTQAASSVSARNPSLASEKPTVFSSAPAGTTAPLGSPRSQAKPAVASLAPSSDPVAAPAKPPQAKPISTRPPLSTREEADAENDRAGLGFAPLVWGVFAGAVLFGAGAVLFLRSSAGTSREPAATEVKSSPPPQQPIEPAALPTMAAKKAPATPAVVASNAAKAAPSSAAQPPVKAPGTVAPPPPATKRPPSPTPAAKSPEAAPARDGRKPIF